MIPTNIRSVEPMPYNKTTTIAGIVAGLSTLAVGQGWINAEIVSIIQSVGLILLGYFTNKK